MLILTHFQKSIYRFFRATKTLITSTESTELAFFIVIIFIIIIIVIIRSQNV